MLQPAQLRDNRLALHELRVAGRQRVVHVRYGRDDVRDDDGPSGV